MIPARVNAPYRRANPPIKGIPREPITRSVARLRRVARRHHTSYHAQPRVVIKPHHAPKPEPVNLVQLWRQAPTERQKSGVCAERRGPRRAISRVRHVQPWRVDHHGRERPAQATPRIAPTFRSSPIAHLHSLVNALSYEHYSRRYTFRPVAAAPKTG